MGTVGRGHLASQGFMANMQHHYSHAALLAETAAYQQPLLTQDDDKPLDLRIVERRPESAAGPAAETKGTQTIATKCDKASQTYATIIEKATVTGTATLSAIATQKIARTKSAKSTKKANESQRVEMARVEKPLPATATVAVRPIYNHDDQSNVGNRQEGKHEREARERGILQYISKDILFKSEFKNFQEECRRVGMGPELFTKARSIRKKWQNTNTAKKSKKVKNNTLEILKEKIEKTKETKSQLLVRNSTLKAAYEAEAARFRELNTWLWSTGRMPEFQTRQAQQERETLPGPLRVEDTVP